jgi:hypothetical protein
MFTSADRQINVIEKRGRLWKAVRKNRKHERSHPDSDIKIHKPFKAIKEFESVLNDEIKKVEEASEVQRKFNRDDSDDTDDEEELVIIEHRADLLTVINTPIQDNLAPAATQPVVKHHRILRDDN